MKKMKKTIIAISIVAVLVLAGSLYYLHTVTAWENKNEFGSWSQQVVVLYTDGTVSQPLNMLWNSFSVSHNGKDVSGIRYILNAKATSSADYTTVNIILTSFEISFQVEENAPYIYTTTATQSILADGVYHQILSNDFSIDLLVPSLPDGTYSLTITPQGSIAFNYDGGPNIDATLPGVVSTSISINGGSVPPGQFEDISTYNHMPIGDTYMSSPTDESIQITDMPRDATCYFQKERVIGTGDFTLSFKILATKLEINPVDGGAGGDLCILLANQITTTDRAKSQAANDGLLVTFREYTDSTNPDGPYFYLMQLRSRQSVTYTEKWCALNTEYTITVSRTAGYCTFTISESGQPDWVRHISDSTSIQYFIPMCGSGGGGAGTLESSGIVSDFDFS